MRITTVGDPVLRERAGEVSARELRSPEVQRLHREEFLRRVAPYVGDGAGN